MAKVKKNADSGTVIRRKASAKKNIKASERPHAKKNASKSRKRTIKKTRVDDGKQRLQKVLASSGIDSRRNCEELILDGAVSVNRQVVDQLPCFVDPETDVITVNGKRIKAAEKVYYMLNKPKGVICTNSDPYGRKKAIDLIDCPERIYCVGRLDADTTGLIILTNDSELTNRLTHPKHELPKTYEVHIKGRVEGEQLEKLKKGVWLSEGRTGKAAVKVIKRTNMESMIQITIRQGLNRQVRRIFARLGLKVKGLKRTMIGNIVLKGISPGNSKKMTKSQIEYLRKVTELK